MPLALTTLPLPDESLPGFLIRLAERSRFQTADRLASRAGLRQPGSGTSAVDLSRLAVLAGVDVKLLDRIAYRPTGRLAHHRFFDGELHREFIDVSHRRACPLCLEAAPHHRAAWDFALMTACPEHAVRLLVSCPVCHRRPGWRHPSVLRCQCGASLAAAAVSAATPVEIEANARVLALAAGADVPWLGERLRACARADLVRILMCFGMFLSGWSGQRRIETLVARGPDTVTDVLTAGVRCLTDWPTSLHAYLSASREQAGARRGRYGARKALGSFYDWLHVLEHTAARQAVVEAARDFVAEDGELASRTHRSSLVAPEGGRTATAAISLGEAAAELGRSGHGVKRLMAAGLIPGAPSEGRGVPMSLDRAAVLGLAAEASGWLSLRGLAAVLGVSRSRTERIVRAGLVRSAHGGPADGWATWSFAREEVERFLGSFAQMSAASGAQVDFDFAAEAFRRRGVDIDGLLSLVLDGELSLADLDPDAVGLKRLRFRRADVHAACRKLENGPLTVQAAAEILGVKWAVVDNLVSRGLLASEPEGISGTEIERFRREYVVGSELAREARTSPRHVAARLSAMGVRPVVGPKIDGSRQNIFMRTEVATVQKTLPANHTSVPPGPEPAICPIASGRAGRLF